MKSDTPYDTGHVEKNTYDAEIVKSIIVVKYGIIIIYVIIILISGNKSMPLWCTGTI